MRPEIGEWLAKARADLDAARLLRTNPEIPTEIVAFHYQQAAEKALRGLLAARGVVPPHIHDLRALLARLGPTLLPQDEAEGLTPFAVLSRYPGFSVTVSAGRLDAFDSFAETCIRDLALEAPGETRSPGSS